MIPSVESTYLLAWLKTQRNILLTRSPVYYKRMKLKKRCIGQNTWKGQEALIPSPGKLLFQHLQEIINWYVLQPSPLSFKGGLLTQTILTKSLAMGNWFNFSPFLEMREMGLKIPILNPWYVPLTTSPQSYMLPNSHLINKKKDTSLKLPCWSRGQESSC